MLGLEIEVPHSNKGLSFLKDELKESTQEVLPRLRLLYEKDFELYERIKAEQ